MSKGVYRAQPIGSLLRPTYLKEARKAVRRGEISMAQFKRIEDRAVDEALKLQEAAGLDVVNDGEQRRASFLGSLVETVEGLERTSGLTKPWYDQQQQVAQLTLGLVVTGKLRRRRSLVGEEFAYTRAKAGKPLKMTLPSPFMLFMFWSPEQTRAAYRDPFELFRDGADIIREEIHELARLGCEYIQIDAPELAMLADESIRRSVFETGGIEATRVLGEGVEMLNALADAPGVSFGLHMCRGNNDGRWMSRGGYEAVSKELFKRASRYEVFLLEYDDWRSGSFEPLADIPRDKFLVLGLVSTKNNVLETEQELLGRIDEASRYFPRDRLALSPQCGFASGIKGNPIEPAMQEKKLRLVAEVAHRVWR
jgi:methionine synthase II (cobalamin-independent)